MPDDLGDGHRPVIGGPPGLQQIVEDGVELLLWRLPGLEEVMVEVDDVDRVDGRFGVRVRGQQHPPGAGVDVESLLEELDAVHLRHPEVGHDHRDGAAAQLQLAQGGEGGLAGLRAHNAVRPAVASPQVTGDSTRHARVVVHSQDDGPRWTDGLIHRHPVPESIALPHRLHVPVWHVSAPVMPILWVMVTLCCA